jgi:dUTP pyrophosphatase
MQQVQVKIINKSRNAMPRYATANSAGVDLMADVEEGKDIWIKPGERALIHTGLYVALPDGFEAQIRPRSGLALKSGITVLNSPGTIDADYRGEIGVILYNASAVDFRVVNGDRIAQMILSPVIHIDFVEVSVLDETVRGDGGFGHTGK